MIKEQIQKLENILDSEINEYKNIEKFYIDKKEILVRGKGTDLYDLDNKITNTFKNISQLSEERKNMSQSMDIPTFSMTDIINKIKTQDSEAAKKFEQKKLEVNTLAQKIFELERTNLELLKHGIYVTNKTIEVMLKGVKTVTKEYNQKGQNIAKEQLEMSSIIEEA